MGIAFPGAEWDLGNKTEYSWNVRHAFVSSRSLWWNCLMFANVFEGEEAVFSRVGGVSAAAKMWMRARKEQDPQRRLFLTYYTFAAGRSENINTFPRKNHPFKKKKKLLRPWVLQNQTDKTSIESEVSKMPLLPHKIWSDCLTGPPSSLLPQRTTGDSCSWHYLNISVLRFCFHFSSPFAWNSPGLASSKQIAGGNENKKKKYCRKSQPTIFFVEWYDSKTK